MVEQHHLPLQSRAHPTINRPTPITYTMEYLGAILNLITATSAIDLAIHFSTQCTTTWAGCTSINPTVSSSSMHTRDSTPSSLSIHTKTHTVPPTPKLTQLLPRQACCYAPGNWDYAASIAYVPSEWYNKLAVRMDRANNCDSGQYWTQRIYAEYACLYSNSGASVGAMRYDFVSRSSSECDAEAAQCTGRQRAAVLGLTDGMRYDLSTLDDEQVADMFGHANATLRAGDMPREFDGLLM